MRLGVDVGATWVRAALADGKRLRRARRRREPGKPLESLLRELLSRWGVRSCDSLVVGAARVWLPAEKRALARRLRPLARKVWVLSDVELAFRACLGGAPGILVVAGTGSIALGSDACGHRARAGGLGPLLGDEGSAFWIGRRWLKSARPEAEALRLAHAPDVVGSVAALARSVARRASSDPICRDILREAAAELAGLAHRLTRALHFHGRVPVSWWGGMFEAAAFRSAFLRALAAADPRLAPRPPVAKPEVAAAQWETINVLESLHEDRAGRRSRRLRA